MKNFRIILLLLLSLVASCSTIKYVPIRGDTVVEYRDTTIFRDSIIYTPKEVVKEIVPALDTLHLETSLASAQAYLDTTNRLLRGSIQNKKGVTEKIKYKEKIVYRDSLVSQDVPVEVQVTKEVKTHFWYEKFLWILSILGLVMIGKKIYPIIKKWLV